MQELPGEKKTDPIEVEMCLFFHLPNSQLIELTTRIREYRLSLPR